MSSQLAPGVVKGLVERAPGGAQSLSEHVDRDTIECDRNEHLALTLGQDLCDRTLDGREQLALLRFGVRGPSARGEERPVVVLERRLDTLPRSLAELHR